MLQLLTSSWIPYFFLAWLGVVIAFSAHVRTSPRPDAIRNLEQRFSWKWLTPVPMELRTRMRMASSARRFHDAVWNAWAAETAARMSEAIARIRGEV
jgi:hypothetical protein